MFHQEHGVVGNSPAAPQLRLIGVVPSGACLATLLCIKLVLFFVFSVNAAFIMDEYWLVGDGLIFERNPYQEVWPAKTLLYALFFRLAHLVGDDAVAVMTVARLQSAFLALAGMALVYGIARRLGRSHLESIFCLVVLVSFASYMEWAFVARPEPLATFLTLLALWFLVRRPDGTATHFIAGMLCGLAFLTLQKAVYFNLALGLALVSDQFWRRGFQMSFRAGLVLVSGWASVLVLYVASFALAGAEVPAILNQILHGSLGNARFGHLTYGNLRIYAARSLVRDIVPYLLTFFGWRLMLPRWKRMSAPERIAWVCTAVICLEILVVHSAPWPYNLFMPLPFLALWSSRLLVETKRAQLFHRPTLLLLVALALSITFYRNVASLNHDNGLQNETVRQAERLLGDDDVYADGIGMIPTKRRAADQTWWSHPELLNISKNAAEGDLSLIQDVLNDTPKVWILSYRTRSLQIHLSKFWANAYVRVSPNILLAGTSVFTGPEGTIFENYWPGLYRLYDADQRVRDDVLLILDGKTVSGEVFIGKGRRRLRVEVTGDSGPFYLLPADVGHSVRVLQNHVQEGLFVDTYDF